MIGDRVQRGAPPPDVGHVAARPARHLVPGGAGVAVGGRRWCRVACRRWCGRGRQRRWPDSGGPDGAAGPPVSPAPCTPWRSGTAGPSRISVRSPMPMPESSGTPGRSSPSPRQGSPAVLAISGAGGIRRRTDGADRIARPPAGRSTAGGSCSGSTMGRWTAAASTTARASSCASARWDAAGRCGLPSRWSWNGRPGNTTSASRRGMWCSLSRRPRGCRRGHGGAPAVPFGWVPGAEGWIGVVPRGGRWAALAVATAGRDGRVRWIRLDPAW